MLWNEKPAIVTDAPTTAAAISITGSQKLCFQFTKLGFA